MDMNIGRLAGMYFPRDIEEGVPAPNLSFDQEQAFGHLMGPEGAGYRQNLVKEAVRRRGINPMFRQSAMSNLGQQMSDYDVTGSGTGGGAFGHLMRGGFGGWVTTQ